MKLKLSLSRVRKKEKISNDKGITLKLFLVQIFKIKRNY